MNFCGCDPLAACTLEVFDSCGDALEHGMTHCAAAKSGFQWGWFGCDFSTRNRLRMELHYQGHLLAQWRCEECGALHVKKQHALSCKHINNLIELIVDGDECKWTDCARENHKMADSAELRNHVFNVHLNPLKVSPFVCSWNNCNKSFSAASSFIRHVQTTHLKLQWKCKGCGKFQKSEKAALNCCNSSTIPLPLLWNLPFTCQWGECEQEFAEGHANDVKAHFKKHVEELEKFGKCKWKDCQFENSKSTKLSLTKHLELRHGQLKFKCAVCEKVTFGNQRKEALYCDHSKKKEKVTVKTEK
jgi:hypothetical protein